MYSDNIDRIKEKVANIDNIVTKNMEYHIKNIYLQNSYNILDVVVSLVSTHSVTHSLSHGSHKGLEVR